MKVHCIKNTGADLRPYEYEKIYNDKILGRFGSTGMSEYNGIDIGREYLVMGILTFKTYQAYLIDSNGFICAYPCQLFELIDDKVNANWSFRVIDKDENIYPYIQAIFGYPELCSDKKAYENLIVEKDVLTQQIYFRRKIELEKELEQNIIISLEETEII